MCITTIRAINDFFEVKEWGELHILLQPTAQQCAAVRAAMPKESLRCSQPQRHSLPVAWRGMDGCRTISCPSSFSLPALLSHDQDSNL